MLCIDVSGSMDGAPILIDGVADLAEGIADMATSLRHYGIAR